MTFPDVEQELLLLWRGDVKAGIINRDGSRAAESIPAGIPQKKASTVSAAAV